MAKDHAVGREMRMVMELLRIDQLRVMGTWWLQDWFKSTKVCRLAAAKRRSWHVMVVLLYSQHGGSTLQTGKALAKIK